MASLSTIFVLGFSLAAQVSAQTIPNAAVQNQAQEPRRKSQLEQQAREEAAAAAERQEAGENEPSVTYEQVLEDPDNVDLNYRWARTQVRNGNLRSASATLERILLVHPDLPRIRLFYAVVLLRLDNLEEAQKEIEELQKEKMPESLRGELDEYARVIRQRRARTHLMISAGTGLDFIDNQNVAPASRQRLVLDVPVMLDPSSTRAWDTAKTFLGSLSLLRDLGYQAGHQLFANANYYRSEQTTQRIFNIQNYSIQAGGSYVWPWVAVTPSFQFDHLLLAEATYIRTQTRRLQFDFKLSERFDVSAEASYARLGYNDTPVVPTDSLRTGDKLEGGATLGIVLTPSQKLTINYTHSNQGAQVPWYVFRREAFTVSHAWIWPRGMFMLIAFTGNYDRYQQPELAVSATNRLDDMYRARATVGLPIELIEPSLRGFNWTFSYEYFQGLSSLLNYAYSSNKLSTMMTYRFDTGL